MLRNSRSAHQPACTLVGSLKPACTADGRAFFIRVVLREPLTPSGTSKDVFFALRFFSITSRLDVVKEGDGGSARISPIM
ncbi:hypothetical protein [Pseudomonas baetica]|uniref:hypothetical protein n=1 Tax=Pseudomonas baetica TaxID=674054 RepID=UPI0024062181|nr:hypothetical protein [Pseudomonas baetica]MDF9778189.1 hypothetical protein [Pseudomonas baetica]